MYTLPTKLQYNRWVLVGCASADGKCRFVNVPLFAHILKLCNYPGLVELDAELTIGFKMMGKFNPGVNWHDRKDSR